ncbi:MAG: hypothetical protein MJY48_05440 [Bacteroidales bacterium]|nr:hypothetical protein [Bacteroidales bacterium]
MKHFELFSAVPKSFGCDKASDTYFEAEGRASYNKEESEYLCAMEKTHVFLDIAGLKIDFFTRFPEYVKERCRKYLAVYSTDPKPLLHLEATDENIRKADRDNVGPMEAELYAMTIPLSELCPSLGRLMTHGVAIECDGNAYIFTAESGVGKSTHAFLWQKYLGEDRVQVINGDKPILWFHQDGEILVCGSPWSGKERLDQNKCLPLKGICLLTRLENAPAQTTQPDQTPSPYITRATREETCDFLMHQVFIPSDLKGRLQTLSLLEKLYEQVPVYNLYINRSFECVKVSSECLLNNKD